MNSNSENTGQLVESFFRHEYANLVAVLTRAFGFALIDVVEDMVQESMLLALNAWRINGVPDNPEAWLHRVARNRIIDALRRDQKSSPLVFGEELKEELPLVSFEADELQDSLLRMMFACCHPTLDRKSQLALTLKVLCGLGDQEVARGLLMSKGAVKKRVTRAKQHLQLNRIALDLPAPGELSTRLETVHDVLYLLFNEGYCASKGGLPLRIDLCEEAARLCHLLCRSDIGEPTTFALLSLMLFHAARFDARVSKEGQVILLEDQNRAKWDRKMMAVADHWLARSASGGQVSRFHLEAGIAKLHCCADSIESTNWQGIVEHYDFLLINFPSPVYRLNRAIAIGQTGDLEVAIEQIRELENEPLLQDYPLLNCALADLLIRRGDNEAAVQNLDIALSMELSERERDLIECKVKKAKEAKSSSEDAAN